MPVVVGGDPTLLKEHNFESSDFSIKSTVGCLSSCTELHIQQKSPSFSFITYLELTIHTVHLLSDFLAPVSLLLSKLGYRYSLSQCEP